MRRRRLPPEPDLFAPPPQGSVESLAEVLRADPGFPHTLGQAWWMAHSFGHPWRPKFSRRQEDRAYRLRHNEPEPPPERQDRTLTHASEIMDIALEAANRIRSAEANVQSERELAEMSTRRANMLRDVLRRIADKGLLNGKLAELCTCNWNQRSSDLPHLSYCTIVALGTVVSLEQLEGPTDANS